MQASIKSQNQRINLILSDSLEAAEETLRQAYLKKIQNFLDSSYDWYDLAVGEIKGAFVKSGGATGGMHGDSAIRLMSIYVLSEQDDERMVFGLLFRVEFDVEHGRGMKMYGDNYEIFEYGLGDVAFC